MRILLLWMTLALPMMAQSEPIKVLTSFTILEDMVQQLGGDLVEVESLMSYDQDTHMYQARPQDVRLFSQAELLVVNGAGLEGWLNRLIESADYRGAIVVATQGVTLLDGSDHHDEDEVHDEGEHHDEDEHHDEGEHHDENEHYHEHEEGLDPHAWHSLDAAAIYAENISRGLAQLRPEQAHVFAQRLEAYQNQLMALKLKAKQQLETLQLEQVRVLTNHAAFAYLGQSLNIEFLSVGGLTTAAEPSAREVAQLIAQIRQESVQSIFVEINSNERLLRQIAKETKINIGGTLLSGALSQQIEGTDTYLGMMEYNINTLIGALSQ